MVRFTLSLVFAIWLAPALPAQSATTAQSSASDTTNFLRPGDAIHLRFFGDSGMSGEFRVDEHGQVALPVLGIRDAVHQTPDQLKTQLIDAYARDFRTAPEVVLLRRITVLGAVAKPGLYLADPTMNISNLLALAGGPMPNGRPDQVQIIRDGKPITAEMNRQTVVATTPLRSGDELYVPERSWLARNTGLIFGAVGSAAVLISALHR